MSCLGWRGVFTTSVYMNEFMRICTCISMRVCMFGCVHACVCVHLYVYACVCVHACESVCAPVMCMF